MILRSSHIQSLSTIAHLYYQEQHEYLPSGRAKRLARLRRCVAPEMALRRQQPKPVYSAVVAEDSFQDDYSESGFSAPSYDESELSETDSTKKTSLAEPKVDLRDFFPETWLFELDPVEEQKGLKR